MGRLDEVGRGLPPHNPFDTSLLSGLTDQEVVRRYLALIRLWRDVRPTARVPIRSEDLAVLVGILGTDADEIERRLIAMSGCSRSSARRFRRMLVLSAASLPLSFAGITGVAEAAAPAVPHAVSATRSPRRAAPHPDLVAPAAPAAVRPPVARPPVAASSTVPQPVAVAAAAGVAAPIPSRPVAAVPDEEATVAIPSLGIDLPIVAGGQAIIDDGVVAHYVAPGWRPPVGPGAVGTYWLAAHDVTHGAPFEKLPEVAIGAKVLVTTTLHTYVYTVTSLQVVGVYAGYGPVYGTDPQARSILLQTCLDSTRRLLVHGTLTAVL
jgi:sortase family protein